MPADDVDDDGDLDVVLVQGPPRVLWNHYRQLRWRSLPRVGYPLALDLFGRAGEPFLLALALAEAALPAADLGTLRLDAASLQLVVCSGYDLNGRAAFSAPVPNDPSLVGWTIYWQALSGASHPRLGNLVRTLLQPH